LEARKVTDRLSVIGQITAADLPALAAQGYRTIICNRPDGEEPGQPRVASIEAAAQKLGLQFRNLPVVAGQIRAADARAFGQMVQELPGPVLAYCRSGARCGALWALAAARMTGAPA
jgi:sulfide:quinone oxidoreductase